jgi:hypothetical protein
LKWLLFIHVSDLSQPAFYYIPCLAVEMAQVVGHLPSIILKPWVQTPVLLKIQSPKHHSFSLVSSQMDFWQLCLCLNLRIYEVLINTCLIVY